MHRQLQSISWDIEGERKRLDFRERSNGAAKNYKTITQQDSSFFI